jgi:hypothetical protein
MTMMVGGGGGALTPHNKFNTISNIHKRGAGGGKQKQHTVPKLPKL